MAQLVDKGMLLIMCFCLLLRYEPGAAAVTAMLLAVTAAGLLTFRMKTFSAGRFPEKKERQY